MPIIENPPLRDLTVHTGPTTIAGPFVRSWQAWFNKTASKFQQIMPTLAATPDIVWDDLRMPATSLVKGGINDPVFGQVTNNAVVDGTVGWFTRNYFQLNTEEGRFFPIDYFPGLDPTPTANGVFSWLFTGSGPKDHELFFEAQMPHAYRPGTLIKPHVHWCKTTAAAGDVNWGLEFTWTNVGGSIGSTTIVKNTVANVATPGNKQHVVTNLADVSGPTKRESSIFLCRIFREQSSAEDTYPDNAALLSVDIHFENEKLGTGPEFPGA